MKKIALLVSCLLIVLACILSFRNTNASSALDIEKESREQRILKVSDLNKENARSSATKSKVKRNRYVAATDLSADGFSFKKGNSIGDFGFDEIVAPDGTVFSGSDLQFYRSNDTLFLEGGVVLVRGLSADSSSTAFEFTAEGLFCKMQLDGSEFTMRADKMEFDN